MCSLSYIPSSPLFHKAIVSSRMDKVREINHNQFRWIRDMSGTLELGLGRSVGSGAVQCIPPSWDKLRNTVPRIVRKNCTCAPLENTTRAPSMRKVLGCRTLPLISQFWRQASTPYTSAHSQPAGSCKHTAKIGEENSFFVEESKCTGYSTPTR